MESHSYPKIGEGAPPQRTQCSHTDAKGARCRMLATADSALCPHHDRQQVIKRRQDQAVAKALIGGLDDFTTPDAITVFLSNLLREVIHKRIDRRDAATMAYISQLLLAGQSAFQRFAAADLNSRGDDFVQTLKAQIAAQTAKHGEPEQE